MAILHKFNGEEVIATELPQLLNQNFDYVNDNRIKTVNNVEYDDNNNIDVTHLVSQSIVSGTDLNNLTTSGEYVRLGSVTKLLNSPSDTPFFLTILASNGLVKQVLTELIVNNPATFTRTMNGTQWSPWIESGANIGTWESNEQVKVGDVRYVGGRDYTGYVLECVQAGTTGDSQPTISSSDIDNSTDLEGFSGTLQIAHGGTGATTAESARSNLGLSYATQAEAEAGTDNTTVMTPLQTKQLGDKNYLKLSGGTITGNLVLANEASIRNGRSDSFTAIYGSGSIATSAYLRLFAKDEPNYGGYIRGQTVDANGNTKALIISPDGTIKYNTRVVAFNGALSMPSEQFINVSVTASGYKYTAPADGWFSLYADITDSSSSAYLMVSTGTGNGVLGDRINIPYNLSYSGFYKQYPMTKGRTYTIQYYNMSINGAAFHYAQSEV